MAATVACSARKTKTNEKNTMKDQLLTRLPKTLLASILLAGATSAATVTLDVPGTSNPWLAGMPNGTTADMGFLKATRCN
jgi:hypothetical protein